MKDPSQKNIVNVKKNISFPGAIDNGPRGGSDFSP